ncbi:MAG TPA: Gfo/Idh/MocA family oxidoreductase [Bacteroidetes bacterium]|nr:Gfo/Idh/MocA family oxidoreductase [Bacteroidota bacterium]
MDTPINWGILAPGRIAHKFASDLGLVKNARLHAVASRSLKRAQAFARQYGAAHAFGSYEEMAKCPGLDVVYIASPHTGHHAHSLLFLKNKTAVLCEKPLAMNAGQVREMVAAARNNDTFLMEAIWTRFIPVFEKTLEMVKEGIIGELNTIRADFGFKAAYDPAHRLFDPALGGGALLDVGLYPVYAAAQFFGRPEEVKAMAIKGETGTDNACAMLFRCPGGKLAVMDCSVINDTPTTATFYGNKGWIKLHSRFHESERATLFLFGENEREIYVPKMGLGYCHEIMEVNNCLRNGQKESAKLPLDFSILLMENLDAVREAAGIVYPGEG